MKGLLSKDWTMILGGYKTYFLWLLLVYGVFTVLCRISFLSYALVFVLGMYASSTISMEPTVGSCSKVPMVSLRCILPDISRMDIDTDQSAGLCADPQIGVFRPKRIYIQSAACHWGVRHHITIFP